MKSISEHSKEEKRLRAVAASLAVALALKIQREAVHQFPLPEQVTLSAWQAVLRSNIQSKRGNVR